MSDGTVSSGVFVADDISTSGSYLSTPQPSVVLISAVTATQLETEFTNANMGEGPDASVQALLAAYASETADGSLTDTQALNMALHIAPPSNGSVGSSTPENTTDVALAVYQFFTGLAPTIAGLDYLVNGGGNPNDLDSAFYAGFNQANRYYNFAINLITGNAAARATFDSNYGGVTFDQAVAASYELIIGTPNVGSATAAAAIAAIEAEQPYFAALASERAPHVNQDLATKAIMIGYILEEAVKADVGYYAFAIDQFDAALANGSPIPAETSSGIDLLANLGNIALSANLGDASVSLQGAAAAGFVDVITGADGNDNIQGTISGGNTDIRLADGRDSVSLFSGTANFVSLGNGIGDHVIDASNGADQFILGNGSTDSVSLTGGGNSTISIGNGANSGVTANDTGNDVIQIGDGANDFVQLGAGHESVTFGSGAGDVAQFHAGISEVTFGGPDATADFGGIFVASFAKPTTASQTSIATSHLNVVVGLVAGDTIYISSLTDDVTTAHNLAGVSGEAVFTTGTYSASAQTFTESASGHDALLTFSSEVSSTFVSVVLVGAAAEVGHSTISGEAITF